MKIGVEEPEVLIASNRISETNNNASGGAVHGVIVRNAIKAYGVGNGRYPVLNGLNMTVKKGTM